jgi:TM2 domain-containing membrane protein YozV
MWTTHNDPVGRYCPYCGAITTETEFFCRACHKRIDNQLDLNVPSTTRPSTYIVELRKNWLSPILSFIGVGLGQFYNGDTLKGIGFIIAFFAVSFGYVDLGPHYQTVAFFGIWIAAIAEALVSARRINHYKRKFKGTSFLLWLGLTGLAAIVLLHVFTGQPDMAYLQKMFPSVALWEIL